MMRIVIALATATIFAPTHDAGPLQNWFRSLHSGMGYCCAYADGIADPEWRTVGSHYEVFLDHEWIEVPDQAVIKGPNLDQKTWVWPVYNSTIGGGRKPFIRCFLPGTMT